MRSEAAAAIWMLAAASIATAQDDQVRVVHASPDAPIIGVARAAAGGLLTARRRRA